MENVNLDIPLIYYHNMTFCTNFEHEDTPHRQLVSLSVIRYWLCSKALLPNIASTRNKKKKKLLKLEIFFKDLYMVFGFRTFSGEKLYTMKKIYLNEKKKRGISFD